ncbi:MAG: glycosyltransferase family 1 protein, partial [Cytophagales bacterium]
KAGTSSEIMSILPYGIKFPKDNIVDIERKIKLRKSLGIPENALVMISVGAINDNHKRMSYIVQEFSKLKLSNTFLILLGQMEKSSSDIISKAKKLLPKNNFFIKSVPYEDIPSYYQCSDIFVLASYNEGFGRVFLEALSFGLPVITHEVPIFHQVMGNTGYHIDLSKENELSNFLTEEKVSSINSSEDQIKRIEYTKKTYSWEALAEKYVEMIEKTAKN